MDEGIGEWSDPEVFEVTRERIAEYAAATNDPIERHRSGDLASPVFAIVSAFTSMIPAAIGVAPLHFIPKIVHGEQDFRFHRPILPGQTLFTRSKAIGYAGAANGSPIALYMETHDEQNRLVNEQFVTVFVRGVDAGAAVGELAAGHKFPEASRDNGVVAKLTQKIDEDQTFRYSPASGDPMPIHLDEEIAKDAGLPGIIAHGLCTMAFASWAAITEVGDNNPESIRRLACRFAKPVLPGDEITTSFYATTSEPGTKAFAFETEARGDLVLKDGLVVFGE